MCLDPRPDRLVRLSRSNRGLAHRPSALHAAVGIHALQRSSTAPVIGASAYRALDALAGDDELVARGWVVLSRDN